MIPNTTTALKHIENKRQQKTNSMIQQKENTFKTPLKHILKHI